MPEEGAVYVQVWSPPMVTVEDIEELGSRAELIALFRAKAEALGNIQVLIRETEVPQIDGSIFV